MVRKSVSVAVCVYSSLGPCWLWTQQMDWKTPSLDGDIPGDIGWKKPPAAASGLMNPPGASPSVAQSRKRPSNSSLDDVSWKRPMLTEDIAESGRHGNKRRKLTEDIAESEPKGKRNKSSMPLASPCPQSAASSSWKTPDVNDIEPPPTVTEESRRAPRHEVNMCRAMLQLILPGEVNKDDKFRKDAANADRIDAAAAKRYCQNTRDCAVCNKKVVLSDMRDLVQMWTNLGDEAQVNYLASMYEGTLSDDIPDMEAVQHRTDYYLDGAKVCRAGFCAILGTTPHTLMKRMRRCLDMRKKLPG